MNLSTIALCLLAWQLLSDGKKQPPVRPQMGLSDILSDDVKNILNSAQKLSDGSCSQADKAGAIFEIMSNPALQNIASGLFGGMGSQTTHEQKQEPPRPEAQWQEQEQNVNSEGYRFETPSTASQEFFKPIDNIADAEVKHKLYWFYDNWYTK